jgi:uncharacterized protein YbjT (DUF2867 family)
MKIAFFGASGMLGRPVAERLLIDGYQIRALVRSGKETHVPKGCEVVAGDLKNTRDIEKALNGCEAIYLSLSVAQTSKEHDFQPEREGIRNILKVAERSNLKFIGYLSSIVQNYQGMNGFDWWAFKIKNEAVELLQRHPIPSIIFRPSTFMENFDQGSYRQGNNIALAGNSAYPMHFISADDYAKMVSNAFKIFSAQNSEYLIQGPEGFTADEAAKVFVDSYKKEKMKVMKLPFWILKLFGKLTPKFNYGARIVEALNNYPEKFAGEEAWNKLGKPQITLKEYAQKK